MPGVLQFSLGLATGSFLTAMRGAESGMGSLLRAGGGIPVIGTAIAGLIGSFTSMHAVVEGVFGAIEKGAALGHLAARTGESVQSLFQLEKGFKAVGLSADSIPFVLLRMQKALGGVNEFGESTKDIFHNLGLSTEHLKTLDAPEQVSAIAGALNRLSREDAALAAGKIFGRGGAGEILQLARSGEAFRSAFAGAATAGAIFARNAERFEQIERTLESVRNKAKAFFLGLAEGVAPAIQGILDALNKINLLPLGQRIGQFFSTFGEAFKEGRLGELLSLSLQAGFERVIVVFQQTAILMGRILQDVFSNPTLWRGFLKGAIATFGQLANALGEIFEGALNFLWAGVLGIIKGQGRDTFAESWAKQFQILQEKNEAKTRQNAAIIAEAAKEAPLDLSAGLAQAVNNFKGAFKDFAPLQETEAGKRLSDLLSQFKAVIPAAEEAGKKPSLELEKAGGKIKRDVDSLSKIGFFSGTGGQDFSRQTSLNTRDTVENLRIANVHLAKIAAGGGAAFVNS